MLVRYLFHPELDVISCCIAANEVSNVCAKLAFDRAFIRTPLGPRDIKSLADVRYRLC
jgi:hypothetical protein